MLVPNRICRGYIGGREIDKFRGVDFPKDDNSPEAWVGSTTYTYHHQSDHSSKLGLAEAYVEGAKKAYLKDIIETDPAAYLGERHLAKFGGNTALLVKLLDAQQQLGLQTHPDRSFAKRYFNSDYGKVESWYVIGTRKDQAEQPYVLLGFKEGITRDIFERLFLEDNIVEMEKWCHKIPVSEGDMYFVDAGTPHAVGPGCFVIEAQEPSDITVGARMGNFDNKAERELFIERTMGCYHYIGRSYRDNLAAYKVEQKLLTKTNGGMEYLLLGSSHTSFFSITRVDVMSNMTVPYRETFSILIVIGGKGKIICDTQKLDIKQGDELFLPANVKNMSFESNGGMLSCIMCYPPEVL